LLHNLGGADRLATVADCWTCGTLYVFFWAFYERYITHKSGIGKHSSAFFFLGDLEHHHTLDCGNWDVAFLAIACLLDLRRRFYDIYTRPDKLKCSNEITLLVFRMCLMIYRWVGVTKVLCLV
jgi:hypothetical protein